MLTKFYQNMGIIRAAAIFIAFWLILAANLLYSDNKDFCFRNTSRYGYVFDVHSNADREDLDRADRQRDMDNQKAHEKEENGGSLSDKEFSQAREYERDHHA